jgi:hypothetical protein
MYDMYPWHKHAATTDSGEAGRPPAPARATLAPQAVRAVQVALDRRDHGGDAAAEPAAALARQ